MIRPIDIRINAAHPELPLAEAVTFTGSPSTVLIRGVPPNCGRWAITAVFVAATFPDGSTTTRAAVQSAKGVWVATLPATATSGRTANGLRVLADGIDENGDAVTGYILGVADFAVASLGVAPAPQPGETSWQMLYFDAVPGTLRKGDVAKVDGVLKFYNGTAWEPFAAPVTFDDAVTPTSANAVKSSGIWSAIWGALSALPTGFTSLYDWCVDQLAGKANKSDATLTPIYSDTPTFSEWTCKVDGRVVVPESITYDESGAWTFDLGPEDAPIQIPGDEYSTELTKSFFGSTFTATRTRTDILGYQLGSQTDKPLASEAEADALRTGKLDKSGGTVTGDLEVVYDTYGFTVKDASGDYLEIQHGVVAGDFWYINHSVAGVGSGSLRLPYDNIIPADIYSIAGFFNEPTTYALNSLCVYDDGRLYRCVNPNGHTGAWVAADFAVATIEDVLSALRTGKANTSDLLTKLDATSAAPAFSSDSSAQYAVGSHVTYNGKLYVCTTATTGGTWVAGSWAEDTMTDPDAVLDITVQNQLRVVAKDGTLLWAQGYDLASTSSATLACDACNNFTFADGATTQAFTLPSAPTGKVGDFGLDIDNSANTGAATMTLTGLDTAFSVVVPKGESLNDMLSISAGELARFYITLSTFRVNNLPTWHIMKQVVENGGAAA